jgi:kynurenine formamidase
MGVRLPACEDMERHPSDADAARVGADEFGELFRAVKTWGRWGRHDERGALHHLTSQRVADAARLVRDGVSVTLSLPLNTRAAAHNPQPADHRMTMLHDVDIGSGSLHLAKDYVGLDYHNDGHTHIDALCHVAYDGSLYNARPADTVTAQDASIEAIEVLKDGLVGRGVLLDIPLLRGVPWLEPGEHVFRRDLEAAELEQGVTVGEGDILLVRTGLPRRLDALGAWDTVNAKAGLHPTAVPLLAERGVAALGCDGNSDTAPSTTEGVAFPIHVLTLNAMGVHLLDYLQFEDLRVACERLDRWEFLFVAGPLRIAGGTGSPINPIAIL